MYGSQLNVTPHRHCELVTGEANLILPSLAVHRSAEDSEGVYWLQCRDFSYPLVI